MARRDIKFVCLAVLLAAFLGFAGNHSRVVSVRLTPAQSPELQQAWLGGPTGWLARYLWNRYMFPTCPWNLSDPYCSSTSGVKA